MTHKWIIIDKAIALKEIIDGIGNLEMTDYVVVDLEVNEVLEFGDVGLNELRSLVLNENIIILQKIVDKFEEQCYNNKVS